MISRYRHTAFLGAALLVACVSGRPETLGERDQGPTGWIEFYCASCVTGWAVDEIRDGRETRVLTLEISRKRQDLLHNPVRMRRVGVAYPPGEVDFLVRLPHSMFRSPRLSERIRVSVLRDVIIPVRIDAHRETELTMEWKTVVGPPLPVANDAASVERLLAALVDPDWGVRWYASEAVGRINGDIGKELRAALQTLASDETYERCLDQETTTQCSLVSEQAKDVLFNVGVQETTTPAGPAR